MIDIPGYTILRPLGQGGMAHVYLAVQQSLGREVVLKIVSPALAQDPEATESFLSEARIAAKLHHPNIVAIHDVGVHDGIAYMAMAYEPAGTVAPLAGKLPDTRTVLRIVRDIADALDFAHSQGVVHRDVKPENILRRRDGSSLLSDFGIARAIQAQTAGTREDTSLGTPHYMSPERLRGEHADGRADLYSLGVVLYQLLTGELPYAGTNAWSIGEQHVNSPVPALPPNLAHVQVLVDAMMAKNPELRPQSGADVVRRIDALLSGITATPTVPMRAIKSGSGRRVRWLTGALLVLLAAAAMALWQPWRTSTIDAPNGGAAPTAASIAVLPFADMSQSKDQEYFSDGLSEELLNLLAKIPGLHVAGRTSAFAFKGKNDDLRSIGHKLGVATLLEGSVRRSGDRVRITAQLINVADGYHLWSETYDRQVTDVFALQDEIAGAVVQALKVKLLPDAQPSATAHRNVDAESYNQYLIGRQFMGRTNADDYRRAIEAYDKAIALDPEFAPAYAGLVFAEISSLQFIDSVADQNEARRKALAAADRALDLDPNLAQGYAARGQLRSVVTWDFAGARADLQRALILSPGDSDLQRRYGLLLAGFGRMPEAIAATNKAIQLDPLSGQAWNNLGYFSGASGQLADARNALKHALEINPDSVAAHFNLGVVSLLEGHPDAALTQFERIPAGQQFRLVGIALAEHDLGHAQKSQQALDAVIASPAQPCFWIAVMYARRGELDRAFLWLDTAYTRRDYFVKSVTFDPLLAKLREDPRYSPFKEKMGLP